MRTRSGKTRTARSVRFGRLDRASDRLDRRQAEQAIRAAFPARSRVRWARGLIEGVELGAGRRATSPSALVAPRGRDAGWTIVGRHSSELERIEGVARIDAAMLAAARHAAASRIPTNERLRFRTSIPRATLVSSLALSALHGQPRADDSRPLALASELSRAGVLALWCLEDGEVVIVPRPDVSAVAGQLHSLDNPAVRWGEESLWFWHGVWIPDGLAARREQLGLTDVLAERNVERRRILVDLIGLETLVRSASGGEPAQQDDYGRLWRLGPLLDDEEYVAVEVVNSTPELDGTLRHYFLRVPPDTKTARAGVAWTFEMNTRDYTLAAQS
jgi:hypothetical protein